MKKKVLSALLCAATVSDTHLVLIVMMLFNWAPKCIEWRQKMAQKFRKNTKKEAV